MFLCAARSQKDVWIRTVPNCSVQWCRRIGWVGPVGGCECAASPIGWVGGSPMDANALRVRFLRQTDTAAAAEVACAKPRPRVQTARSSAMLRRMWSCHEGFCSLHMLGNITSAKIPTCSWLQRAACSGLENVHAALTSQDVTAINRQQEVYSQKPETDLRSKGGRCIKWLSAAGDVLFAADVYVSAISHWRQEACMAAKRCAMADSCA